VHRGLPGRQGRKPLPAPARRAGGICIATIDPGGNSVTAGLDPGALQMAIEAIRDFAQVELPPQELLQYDAEEAVRLDIAYRMPSASAESSSTPGREQPSRAR
jgi:hypothetical protein